MTNLESMMLITMGMVYTMLVHNKEVSTWQKVIYGIAVTMLTIYIVL